MATQVGVSFIINSNYIRIIGTPTPIQSRKERFMNQLLAMRGADQPQGQDGKQHFIHHFEFCELQNCPKPKGLEKVNDELHKHGVNIT